MLRVIKNIILLLGLTTLAGMSLAQSAPRVAVLYDKQFLLHNTGDKHPERPERLQVVVESLLGNQTLKPFIYWPKISVASYALLRTVHQPDYLALVEREVAALGKSALGILSTGDTMISPHTLNAAKLAVGAGVKGVDEVMAGRATSAFALVRPPGHHATASRGMGFCVYNNIAIAAKHLQSKYGLKRILIVDFDVHHGNGTQDVFYEDGSVFYFSVHQHPLYPGTGRQEETGVGEGLGTTLNVELPVGAGDDDLLHAVNTKLKPAMRKFKPEFILVSAGFDSHANDLLGGLNYTDDAYAKVTEALLSIAKPHAKNRIVYILEGGYTLENIKNSIVSILQALVR